MYSSAGLAVNTTESPWQKLVGPLGVMDAVGAAPTVIVTGADVALHPDAVSVNVTT